MLLKDFIPAADLREIVQLYRIVHLKFDNQQVIPPKAYPPRPEQCLAFYPYDRETVKYNSSHEVVSNIPVVLYGQFTEVTHRYINRHFLVFQVIFNPGGLYRLTGLSSSEITNKYLDATTVFSNSVNSINEQLYHAGNNYNAMVDIANSFIRGLMKKSKKEATPIDVACIQLLHHPDKYSLAWLAKQACVSSRQLERIFKDRTGVNPTLFKRIINFDNAFRLKNAKPAFDWLRIAMACNYHDYQHLAKTYKDFTGLSPVAFHEIENKAPERIVGLSEGYYDRKME